jgi:UDP-glucose 4-epimerase
MMCPPSQRPTILVTGGCGYIGSHTITCLLEADYNVVIADNLSNSSKISLDRVANIVGLTNDQERKERLVFNQVDICDEKAFRLVFQNSPTFQACIHFAGLKVCRSFPIQHGRE